VVSNNPPAKLGWHQEVGYARVSTRKVDDLVKALGIDSGISKSEVSRMSRRPRWVAS
jgi:hypothetical protein